LYELILSLFSQVLLSPDYLPAMKRRRNADQVNGAQALSGAGNSSSGTASQLGSAMDELMRHQPSLRVEAINSIIKLLNRLIEMGRNPHFICQRQSSSSSSGSKLSSKCQYTYLLADGYFHSSKLNQLNDSKKAVLV